MNLNFLEPTKPNDDKEDESTSDQDVGTATRLQQCMFIEAYRNEQF